MYFFFQNHCEEQKIKITLTYLATETNRKKKQTQQDSEQDAKITFKGMDG